MNTNHDKLEILLKKIELSESSYSFFNNGILNKIKINKENNEANFILKLKTNLPIDIYSELKEKINDTFKEMSKITITIEVEEENKDLIEYYYKYFISLYSDDNPLLNLFVDNNLIIDNEIKIEVANYGEKLKLKSILEQLKKDFINVGFECNIKIIINDVLNDEIKKEINESLDLKIDLPIQTPVKDTPKSKYMKDYKRPPLIIDENENVLIGKIIDTEISRIDTIYSASKNVTIEAYIFTDLEVRDTKTDLKIITLKLTDDTDSIYGKIFVNNEKDCNIVTSSLKKGKFYKFRGEAKEDLYAKELTIIIKDINISTKEKKKRIDDAEIKRVELHAHTVMSQMDGVMDEIAYIKQAMAFNHKAAAVTDHNGVQSFPHIYTTVRDYNKNLEEGKEPFKAIYGTELLLIDDTVNIVLRPTEQPLLSATYVVFDFETTGFNAGGGDSIIEVGAVKIKNGEIIDRFNELIDPGKKLSSKIIEVTNITDEMLVGKPKEEEVIKKFIDWFGNEPMVAHNAKFDVSFLEMAYEKYNLGEFKNTVIDTLELSRTLDNTYGRHSLSALVKRYNIPFDEESHHRADYDALATALVLHQMLVKLDNRNYEKIKDLASLVSKDEIHKYGRGYHVNILAKNKVGLKNLFKIISLANTKYLYKTPRILRSEIDNLREGLLIGSGCYESEVFIEARSKSDEELTNIINFYDYVEVQPLDCYDHLIQMNDFKNVSELINHIKKIINVSQLAGKIVVATGDVHQLNDEDKIYRQIIVNQKVPGGGRHPLARNEIKNIPSLYFRTTREMLEAFDFLDEEEAFKIVVTNTNLIADQIDILEVIIETGGVPFSPRVKDDDGQYLDCPKVVTELVYETSASWYGDILPYNIEERIAKELYGDIVLTAIKYNLKDIDAKELEKKSFENLHEVINNGFHSVKDLIKKYIQDTTEEKLNEKELEKKLKKSLGGIIGGGFDPIYLIAQRLVKKSNDDGFLVGSRGSVGSSFVATLMGITEVNPLPAHYRCSKCKCSIFDDKNGNALGAKYSSGFDLPDMKCPNCDINMIKDGQDMPFATFLGFNADKVPDIDLNFSDLNQGATHEYTKVLFGVDNVYRAGTIGTVADKTAYGFVKGYLEEKNIIMRGANIDKLALGCTGVKRTTGQHPGGIVVIPDYMDVFDFTPFQFPADDPTSAWRTTHFDYHAIQDDVLKLDILGHSDPTQLRMIKDLTGTDVTNVPLDDKETMGIFLSPSPLGVTKEQIMCETGTLGIPEFGTKFTLQMLSDTKPKTFAELVKISGLSHGTDVWLGNAQELIKNKIVPFSDVIGCRDDIMVYLMYNGLPAIKAFKIMEFVRKGKASNPKEKEQWLEYENVMKEAGIADWFIDSCYKIKYMFPKAHAAAYVISAFRIAWYKVHMPVYYYASWLSSKATDFDVETMILGYNDIKNKLIEIEMKGNDATNKEAGIYESLHVCLEATARNIKFLNVDLYKSEATTFVVNSENEIIPPFSSIDGLGDTVAQNIVLERKKQEFYSIEDLQKRAKISTTLIDKMRIMGILDGMDESSQLTLF